MSYRVTKNEHVIDLDTRSLISVRYKRITKAVNQTFWNSISDTAHSFYVGSYGRGTAINTSDLDVLIELLVQKFLNKWTIFLFCSILFSSNQKEH